MPWATTSVMDERIRFVLRATGSGVNFSQLCRDFGISRPTGYLWLQRYRKVGSVKDLGEHSRRPHHLPSKTPLEYELRIIGLRLKYDWGAKKLRELLLRDDLDISEATINRILKRNGLIDKKDSHLHGTSRFERDCPNELWQMDFKGDYLLGGGRYIYPLSILDDHSRFVVGLYALTNQDTPSVYDSLIRTFETHGVPDAMLMDHGIPWWANSNDHGLTRLSVSLIKQGIKLYFSGVRHPQTQGKVERFHRTLEHAVRHKGRPKTVPGWRKLFDTFLEEYNHVRPHEALDMATPAQRYQPSQRVYNPHPRDWEYPSGAIIKRLNPQGSLDYKRHRYFVCHALCGELVQVEKIENKLLIKYRHMYIREINKETGKSISLLTPTLKTKV